MGGEKVEVINDKISLDILLELRRFNSLNEEGITLDKEIREAVLQMGDYLKEHQAIIDLTLKDFNLVDVRGAAKVSQQNEVTTAFKLYTKVE